MDSRACDVVGRRPGLSHSLQSSGLAVCRNQRRGPRTTRQCRPSSWGSPHSALVVSRRAAEMPRAGAWPPSGRAAQMGRGVSGHSLWPGLGLVQLMLGPECVLVVSSLMRPLPASLHGLPCPLLACDGTVAGSRPRGQDIPSEVMMPIT